ncbi:ATP-binding cassette domain-containing protein [Subtercola sp. Z020]|uniref:ATP-binding cassette domain-containing protein n=1 Tax=Subtercola sp. Z020 TaxID=2080582 RepID=UPI00130E330C|nr:ATP-binding cassette domain-containing protein [Subtercola sp. Z020]
MSATNTEASPGRRPGTDADADAIRLDLRGIRRTFGETVALNDVSMTVRAGTVHTILGENGSGKSTLVKILSGVLKPSRGSVQVGGRELVNASPRKARQLGIATVFQEVLVAPNRTVTENVLLGQDSWFRYSLKGAARADAAQAALRELSGHPFDPRASVGDLSLVQQHQVAIARALVLEPSVLVLDESTAALDIGERDLLFAAVRRRVQAGMAVVFISHRMDEMLSLSDEVTVLRSGSRIATLQKNELSERRLLALLNGEEGR